MARRGPDEIDMRPEEYRVIEGKRKEPILGERWYVGVAYIVSFAVMATVVHLWGR